MACDKRETTGFCNHDQCPYPTETENGYKCVDIIIGENSERFCEIGEGCLPKCPFSWQPNTDRAIRAELASRALIPTDL